MPDATGNAWHRFWYRQDKKPGDQKKLEAFFLFVISLLFAAAGWVVATVTYQGKVDCFNEYANANADYTTAISTASRDYQANTAEFFAAAGVILTSSSNSGFAEFFAQIGNDLLAGDVKQAGIDMQAVANKLGQQEQSPAQQRLEQSVQDFNEAYAELIKERKEHPVPEPPRKVC